MLKQISYHHIENVTNFAAKVVCEDEPMCRYLAIKPEDFIISFKDLIAQCCTTGFSYLVADECDKIIAISLALPYDVYENLAYDVKDSLRPVLAILDDLDMLSVEAHTSYNTIYHFLIATDLENGNKGYSKQVIEATISEAKSRGFSVIVADATNPISQHLLINRFDYEIYGGIDYCDFCYMNVEWFKDLPGSVVRVVKIL